MTSPNQVEPGSELGRLLLLAYAAGDQVVGDWSFLTSDPMVPDVQVEIERVDSRDDAPVSNERSTYEPEGRDAFEERLRNFVLLRFSQGYDIEGTWRVRFARMDLPDWNVRISWNADQKIVRAEDRLSSIK